MFILRRILNIFFTLAGLVLIFRFIFLILGADPNNEFVAIIYNTTEPFVSVFRGIFPERDFGRGVLEPATLIAMVILSIISWLVQSIFANRRV